MQNQPNLENLGQHSDTGQNIKLATLIQVRWLAVFGQSATVLFTTFYLSFELPFALCFMVIACSAWLNLGLRLRYSANTRLSPKHATLPWGWDIFQLATLLFLTGGLHNPISLLLLGPVTISATVMSLRSTTIIGGTAIILVTLLAEFHLPLRTDQGFVLRVPDVFVFGNWAAIIIAVIFFDSLQPKF
jgi:two-component system sensor histidine kinase RegB